MQGRTSEGQIVESNWFPKRYDGFFGKKAFLKLKSEQNQVTQKKAKVEDQD